MAIAPRNNIVFIQILRGLAPLAVVFAHVPELWLQNTGNRWLPSELYIKLILDPLQINGGGGKIGVIIFFLISGFIISSVAQQESRTEFLIKRVFRIFPGLIFATLVGYGTYKISALNHWGPIYSNDAVTAADFIRSAFMISWIAPGPRALSVAWSLMPELIFYSLVFSTISTLRSRPLSASWILFALSFVLIAPMGISSYFHYLGHFTVYLPIFLVGRTLYLQHERVITGAQALAFVALYMTVFCAVYESRFPGDLFRQYGMIFNVAYSLSVFYIAVTLDPKRCPGWIAFFSKISYSLYLVHLSVGIFVLQALSSVDVPFSVKFAVALLFSVLVATLGFYAVEKPGQTIARRLLTYRRQRSLVE